MPIDCLFFVTLFSVSSTGDLGEQGDKGPIGKAIEGRIGDQGDQGMTVYTPCIHRECGLG